MHRLFRAVRRILNEYPNVKAIYPIHMNPLIWKAVDEIFRGGDRIHLIETFDVIDFHNFIAHSYMIFTDSEGIQEETSNLAEMVLVMRDTTERPG